MFFMLGNFLVVLVSGRMEGVELIIGAWFFCCFSFFDLLVRIMAQCGLFSGRSSDPCFPISLLFMVAKMPV